MESLLTPHAGYSMKKWCLLHAKPHKEDFLWTEACARNINCFYPCIRIMAVNPRSRKIRPYFPGYLFVEIDPESTETAELRWLPGSIGLVRFGEEPATVPEVIVQAIRRQVEALNLAGGNKLSRLQNGDPVDIIEGPFKGYEAIFDAHLSGDERVRLLLKMVKSRLLPVEMAAASITPKKRQVMTAR